MSFSIVPGTVNLRLDEVAHVLVPGRGRDDSGYGLTLEALARVRVAAALYTEVVEARGGRIVCSGYKSPLDRKGAPWSPGEPPGTVFCGMPEAELMKRELVGSGVPDDAVRAESRSIDTVTNFLRSEREGHFGDDRPVAVVAQEDHLHRMMSVIAPRTLRRDYLGVVAPSHSPRREGRMPALVSRLVTARLPAGDEAAIEVATARVTLIWRAAEVLGMRSYH